MHEPSEKLLRGALARIDADIHRVVGLLEGIPFIVADAVDELPPAGIHALVNFALEQFLLLGQLLLGAVSKHGGGNHQDSLGAGPIPK